MKKNILKKETGGIFSLLGLLLATAIVCFLASKAFTIYFGRTTLDKETKKSLSEQGIDATGPIKILNSAKDTIKESEKKAVERQGE